MSRDEVIDAIGLVRDAPGGEALTPSERMVAAEVLMGMHARQLEQLMGRERLARMAVAAAEAGR